MKNLLKDFIVAVMALVPLALTLLVLYIPIHFIIKFW
jgi:uncharacterized membrane protein